MLNDAPIFVSSDETEKISLIKRAFAAVGFSNPVRVMTPGEADEYLAQTQTGTKAPNLPLLFFIDHAAGESGMELMRKIREHALLRRLPLIVLAGAREMNPVPQRTTRWERPTSLQEWVEQLIPLRNTLTRLEQQLAA